MQAVDAPYQIWAHRKNFLNDVGTIVYKGNKNPTYARRKQGIPIQILHDEDYNECLTLTERLEKNVFRPQYIVLYEFVVNDNFFAYEVCMHKFN